MTTASERPARSARRLVALALCFGAFSPALAFAQGTATDRALAQSLFDDARRLMTEGKFAEACPKLAESQRLDPGGGTLINLALCHEKEGKTASAWSEFNEALGQARKDGRQDREASAREHIAALESRLLRLTIDVAPASRVEGLVIKLDGVTVGPAAFGNAFPVDPGTHVVEATAPLRRPWKTNIDAAPNTAPLRVSVPVLEDDPEAREKAAREKAVPPAGSPTGPDVATTRPVEDESGKRTAGFVIGGIGVASLAVGAIFGVQALSKRASSDKECPQERCTAKGVELNDDAMTSAWIANAGIGVGLVAVGVGGYLVLTSRSSNTTTGGRGVRVSPLVGARSGGLMLQGALD